MDLLHTMEWWVGYLDAKVQALKTDLRTVVLDAPAECGLAGIHDFGGQTFTVTAVQCCRPRSPSR